MQQNPQSAIRNLKSIMSIQVTLLPALSDNYIYLLELDDGQAAVVDPAESGPVQSNVRTVDAGNGYEEQYDEVVKERLQQAGVRLGVLLNDIFQ